MPRDGGSRLGALLGAGDGHSPRPHMPTDGTPSPGAGCCKQERAWHRHRARCPLPAAHPCGGGMLGPITAAAPCHPWGHVLPGAFQPWRSSVCVPKAAAVTAPKSKIPSLWPGRRQEWLCPCTEQKERSICQPFISQYFTELCFPYLVQLKSQGEVLYKSKFF